MTVKLKICGMRFPENIIEISLLQPDFLGFIFYPKSIRYYDLKNIPDLPKNIQKVGVFVDASIEFIHEKINKYSLDFVQLHGNESAAFCSNIKELPVKIIKAFSIDSSFDFAPLNTYENHVDYFLFDTKGKLPGGNGIGFDWQLLANYKLNKPYFLSGGIGLADISKINDFLETPMAQHCFAIDVNSQFENDKGEKNKNELQTFKNLLYVH